MIITEYKIKLYEVFKIIERVPYYFTDDDLDRFEFNISDLYKQKTLDMLWITKYNHYTIQA